MNNNIKKIYFIFIIKNIGKYNILKSFFYIIFSLFRLICYQVTSQEFEKSGGQSYFSTFTVFPCSLKVAALLSASPL